VEYDDVMNKHREAVYSRRRKALAADDLKDDIIAMVRKEVEAMVVAHTDSRTSEINHQGLRDAINTIIPVGPELATALERGHETELADLAMAEVEKHYEHRTEHFTPPVMRMVERYTYISSLDRLWIEHLEAMDSLRSGIGLRAIGQRDPLVEYKREGFRMFKQFIALLDAEIATTIFRVSVTQDAAAEAPVETALTRAAEQSSTNVDVDGISTPAGGSRQERRAKVHSGGGSTKKHKKRR
jgi:preprotein translocase subunit SecA